MEPKDMEIQLGEQLKPNEDLTPQSSSKDAAAEK